MPAGEYGKRTPIKVVLPFLLWLCDQGGYSCSFSWILSEKMKVFKGCINRSFDFYGQNKSRRRRLEPLNWLYKSLVSLPLFISYSKHLLQSIEPCLKSTVFLYVYIFSILILSYKVMARYNEFNLIKNSYSV